MQDPTEKLPDQPSLPHFPGRSELCTKSLHTFVRDCADILGVFLFSVQLASKADEVSTTAARVLMKGVDPASDEYRKYEQSLNNPDVASKRLAEYSNINSRHLTTSTADAFLWYISNIIQGAIKRRPELLKSSEMVRVDELIDFRTRKDLVEYLIDRKVNDLSYGGIRKMEAFLKERLGIDMFIDREVKDRLILFMEVRNIYVHNRGIVNSVFLGRVKETMGLSPELGKRVRIDFDRYSSFQSAAVKTAIAIDQAIARKFRLKRQPLHAWNRENVGSDDQRGATGGDGDQAE